MAICLKCGATNQTGKFCTECGARLELNVTVPAPQAPVAAEALAAGISAAPVSEIMDASAAKVEQAFAEAKAEAAAVVEAVPAPAPAPAPAYTPVTPTAVSGTYPAAAAAAAPAAAAVTAPAAATESFISKLAKAADTASDKIQAAIDGGINADGTPKRTTEVPYTTTSTSARLGGEPTSTYHAPDPASLSGSYPSSPAGYAAPVAAAPAATAPVAAAAAPAAASAAKTGTYPSSPAGYTAPASYAAPAAYTPAASPQPVAYTADGQPIAAAPAQQSLPTWAKVVIGVVIGFVALGILGAGATACVACMGAFV